MLSFSARLDEKHNMLGNCEKILKILDENSREKIEFLIFRKFITKNIAFEGIEPLPEGWMGGVYPGLLGRLANGLSGGGSGAQYNSMISAVIWIELQRKRQVLVLSLLSQDRNGDQDHMCLFLWKEHSEIMVFECYLYF